MKNPAGSAYWDVGVPCRREEAINSSIADESSSSYAFATSSISSKLSEADPEGKRTDNP